MVCPSPPVTDIMQCDDEVAPRLFSSALVCVCLCVTVCRGRAHYVPTYPEA